MAEGIFTIKELREHYVAPKNTNVIHKHRLSQLDKLALFVTEKIGTLGFFFIVLTWTFTWLLWNILAPKYLRFDPFPAFVLWLFISNMIQIHLMPLIMVGQNIQGRHAELRSEHAYQTATQRERENEAILLHLENQSRLIARLLEKVEKLENK